MGNSLLDIQPHKVSTDLSGYITYIYGAPKTGKTTLATQMEGSLLLAFEPGYNALPGVMAKDILSWKDMRTTFKELKDPEVHKIFKAVIIDTIDIAADRCKKYVCQQNGIEDLGDLGYGKGWTKFKDEFNEIFRGLTQLGYAVFFIGHDKETLTQLSDGTPISLIRPALTKSVKEVITGMADIYGYAHQPGGDADKMSILTLRDPSGLIDCGCRIKYIKPEFELSYSNLVSEMAKAIEREAKEHDGQYITTERNELPVAKEYNLPELLNEFNEIIAKIPGYDDVDGSTEEGKKFAEFWFPSIQRIVESNLGKGKKISQATADQVEMVAEIVEELTDLIAKNN